MAPSTRFGSICLVAAALSTAACGNAVSTEIVGAVGVTATDAGAPRVLLAVCTGAVGFVELYAPHRGSETTAQRPIGSWKVVGTPRSGDLSLDLEHPGPGWKVRVDPGRLDPDVTYTVLAGSSTEDEALSQADFSVRRLRSLPRDAVLFRDARTASPDAFRKAACD
jgi:hypothetical protein